MVRDGSGWFVAERSGAHDHCRRVAAIVGRWPPSSAHSCHLSLTRRNREEMGFKCKEKIKRYDVRVPPLVYLDASIAATTPPSLNTSCTSLTTALRFSG